jgi:3-hydroxyacyl-CoA dehydrogenase/enoyl-CoA hydratase/3-hydroxybutyryl-CoA epimerase
MALDAVALGVSEPIEASLARERASVLALAATPECRNLIRVFYLQERAKKLRIPGTANLPIGSSQPSQPPSISHVAVIGAGVMGSAIAQWLSSRGLRVLMRDIDPERVAAGVSRIADLYASAVKRHILGRKEARDGMDRISPAAIETPLNSIDLVIEAAVEKMDLKKQIFARLDDAAPPRTILATNTSALSITELAAAVKRPDRVAGIHFFNPVHKMQLVEVITGEQTSPDTAAAAVRFVQKIGKMPVLVRDSPGFLVNRILLPYLVEAGDLFAQGAAVAEIDAAMLDFGMPMGPLRLIDEVGLDVAEDVAATLASSFPGHMHVPAVIARMLAAGLLGKKSGRGLYLHKRGNATPNPEASNFRDSSPAASPPGRMAMQRRMVLLMVNEAARCIEEKVVAEPADVDFGMIMGAGFAPFRGGPLRYVDSLGAAFITTALTEEAAQCGPHFAPCELLQEMARANRAFYALD